MHVQTLTKARPTLSLPFGRTGTNPPIQRPAKRRFPSSSGILSQPDLRRIVADRIG